MLELNVRFLDLYKDVDRFIRDAYGSPEGVREYLRQMQENEYAGRLYVPSWKADYDRLNHLRLIRNQLSHDVALDSDFCKPYEYEWLEDFRGRLYAANDPMAAMCKAQEAESQRRAQRQQQQQTQGKPAAPKEPTPHKTLWQKIKAFFAGE